MKNNTAGKGYYLTVTYTTSFGPDASSLFTTRASSVAGALNWLLDLLESDGCTLRSVSLETQAERLERLARA